MNCSEFEFGFELIFPMSGMYSFGITSRNYYYENGDRKNKIEFGFWLLVICLSFYVYPDGAPIREDVGLNKQA